MRYLLSTAVFTALFVGSSPSSHAQALRTGDEANEYLFVFYALDDLMREFAPDKIEAVKKSPDTNFYADRFGALFHKRRLLVNQLQRRAEVMKMDPKLITAIDEAQALMKHVGAYQEKLREAQNHYDLGFRAIQAKLFTDAELRDKLIQSFIDAEAFYINKVGSSAPGGKLSEYKLRGISYAMKRRAVAEYRLSKNRQKLAEDVHAACLKYEAEHRPALEAKIDSIHQEFARDYDQVNQKACLAIAEKFKPLAGKMGVSESQVVLNASKKGFDWSRDGSGREKDPFRLIAQARTIKIDSSEDARKAHEFARECLKAIEWIPIGDARDTSEVFFYYRGLLCGWAGTLATRAAAIQIGTDSLDKCYRFPADSAGTALYAWSRYKSYERSGAFSKTHALVNNVYAHAYAGKVQEALKLAKDSAGERVDDPNYFYVLARLSSVYKFGNAKHMEQVQDQGTQYLREAMLLGFTGVEEAKLHPDFEKMRQNPKISSKLNQAMFEPDNLFKLTKLDRMTRK
jgi:hypothetical protein